MNKQIAGAKCGVCDEQVILQHEGIACANCGEIQHRACVEGRCPSCKFDLSSSVVFAQSCPVCGRSNGGAPICHCGQNLAWITPREFHMERLRLQRLAFKKLCTGLVWSIGALLSVFMAGLGLYFYNEQHVAKFGFDYVIPVLAICSMLFLAAASSWCARRSLSGIRNLLRFR